MVAVVGSGGNVIVPLYLVPEIDSKDYDKRLQQTKHCSYLLSMSIGSGCRD